MCKKIKVITVYDLTNKTVTIKAENGYVFAQRKFTKEDEQYISNHNKAVQLYCKKKV